MTIRVDEHHYYVGMINVPLVPKDPKYGGCPGDIMAACYRPKDSDEYLIRGRLRVYDDGQEAWNDDTKQWFDINFTCDSDTEAMKIFECHLRKIVARDAAKVEEFHVHEIQGDSEAFLECIKNKPYMHTKKIDFKTQEGWDNLLQRPEVQDLILTDFFEGVHQWKQKT